MRMRPDLEVRKVSMRGRSQWSIKDPLALRFFQLREEEYFVLRQLDGRTSQDEIVARFEREYSPRRLAPVRLQAYLGMLHRNGLVVSEAPGQGAELLERRGRLIREAWLEGLTNVLALRLRGVDPNRFLGWLEPKCRWMFSRVAAVCGGALVLAALTLVAVHLNTLQSRLPDFQAFFSAGNLVWLAVVLAGTKILHELGHGVTCRHFGGRCHELGLMLLVFTPCLYCDVSDAWMFADKRRRIAVGAAGMIVELVLASVATFLWWWSEPGLLNNLCLDVMFISSVSTVIFNGNPLLRYDGYYILSDLLETPNLHQQSSGVVWRWAAKWLLDVDLPADRLLPERGHLLLALYAVASTIYRLVVVVAILWCFRRMAVPYHAETLVDALGVMIVGGMIVAPVVRGARWLKDQQRRDEVRWGRLIVRGGLLIAVAVGVLCVPLPHRVKAPVVLEPHDARRVYVTVPGRLLEAAANGEHVEQGQILARLENLDVALEIAQLTGERDTQRMHLANLQSRQGADPEAASEIPTARQSLADIDERLARRRKDAERLTLVAPQTGTVLPPPNVVPHSERGQLSSWSDTPLEPRNRGTYLETGTLVCLVGDPGQLEAVAVVDQADIDFVHVGQRARIELDELPGQSLEGRVTDVAALDLQIVPRELVAPGGVASHVDPSGAARPLEASYQARVTLDSRPFALRSGGSGRVKIVADSQSLGRRLARYLDRTFRFQW
jgi:putative peptide zinc metalloprotease protein